MFSTDNQICSVENFKKKIHFIPMTDHTLHNVTPTVAPRKLSMYYIIIRYNQNFVTGRFTQI